MVSKPQIYIASLELIWPALLLGPLIVVRIGMLLEDFQVGVVLCAEREGRSQFSKHYIYTLCFCSPLEKSIKSTRSVKGKKEKKKKKKTYELLATKCTDGFGLGCFHGSSVGVDFGTGSSCVGLLLLAMDAVFLGDGHLFFCL